MDRKRSMPCAEIASTGFEWTTQGLRRQHCASVHSPQSSTTTTPDRRLLPDEATRAVYRNDTFFLHEFGRQDAYNDHDDIQIVRRLSCLEVMAATDAGTEERRARLVS